MVLKRIDRLIDSKPDVYGGQPRLARSGFPLIQLVADYQAGMRSLISSMPIPRSTKQACTPASPATSLIEPFSTPSSKRATPKANASLPNGWLLAPHKDSRPPAPSVRGA